MTCFTQCSVGCTDSVVKCWKLLQCICISQVPACCVQCMQEKCLSCTGSIQLHVVWSCGHGQDVCWIRCGTDHGPHHGRTHGEHACPHCQPTRVVIPCQLLDLVHVSCAYRPACIDHNCSTNSLTTALLRAMLHTKSATGHGQLQPKRPALLCLVCPVFPVTGADVVQVLLPVVIYTAGPISGAHFNPMVTSVFMMARMQVLLFSML